MMVRVAMVALVGAHSVGFHLQTKGLGSCMICTLRPLPTVCIEILGSAFVNRVALFDEPPDSVR
jgi:hypothetical protein